MRKPMVVITTKTVKTRDVSTAVRRATKKDTAVEGKNTAKFR
jgi:hypothetical protein